MLEGEFDVSIEGKSVQNVVKHKNKVWNLIFELGDKNVIMQKFRGKIVIFIKFESKLVLINVNIKQAQFAVIDQERREINLNRGKEKIVD